MDQARIADRATLQAAQSRFGSPSALDLRAFEARHPEAGCHTLASGSKSQNTLRAAARIVGQMLPGPMADDRVHGIPTVSLALVVSYALLLDAAIEAEAAGSTNPVASATLKLTRAEAAKMLKATLAPVRRAIGQNTVWQSVFDDARDSHGRAGQDATAARLGRLAAGIEALVALGEVPTHSLTMEALGPHTAASLRELAQRLESAASATNTPLNAFNDSPALNLLEGRLLHALRVLLRQVREAREEKRTTIVLKVNVSLLRQLDLSRKSTGTAPTEVVDDLKPGEV